MDLRQSLDELRTVLAAADTPPGAANLWTKSVDIQVATLVEQAADVPDRTLRGLVQSLHHDVVALRGMSTPTNDDLLSDGVALDAEQRRLLKSAATSLERARDRIRQSVRKGGRPR